MKTHVGYTEEKFSILGDKIYKYTNNIDRASFLKSQANHLSEIHKVLPNNTPSDIKWVETDTTWGYEMEYIKNVDYVSSGNTLDKVISLLHSCSLIYEKNSIPSFFTFADYIEFVINKDTTVYDSITHKTLVNKYIPRLRSLSQEYEKYSSSSHGDFTIENILVSDDRVILIDCILKEGIWSSWLIDAAKFYQNIYFADTSLTLEFTEKLSKTCDNWETVSNLIYLLMITNYIRMFPYIKNKKSVFDTRYKEFTFLIEQL